MWCLKNILFAFLLITYATWLEYLFTKPTQKRNNAPVIKIYGQRARITSLCFYFLLI